MVSLALGPRISWSVSVPPVLRRVSSRGMLRLINRVRPDVIVSVYPNVTEVLGRLRDAGVVIGEHDLLEEGFGLSSRSSRRAI